MLKIHYHPFSTYARRVIVTLLEKNIPHELVTVDMVQRAHKRPEYLSVNPYGRVPALVEDDFVEYLVRNTFSLADICYLPRFDYLPLIEVIPPPAIAAWVARLSARPCVQKTQSS